MLTEADTCRKYVLPKLYASGWNDDQISEQKTFTDGRIVVVGEKCFRKKQKRADYLYQYFQTPSYWAQIIDEKKGTGQPNVNGKKLANIRVPIAPPDEQRHIIAYLGNLQAKVDALKRLQTETTAELDALLPSILDKAFKGEL